MPEQANYFDKFLESQFNRIDQSIKHIDEKVNEIKTEVDKIKDDNKSTRRWVFGTVVGTGLTILLGLAALLVTFAQIQNSWMQQVFSFVGKAIMK